MWGRCGVHQGKVGKIAGKGNWKLKCKRRTSLINGACRHDTTTTGRVLFAFKKRPNLKEACRVCGISIIILSVICWIDRERSKGGAASDLSKINRERVWN